MVDFLKLAQPGITELSPYQPGKPVEELERELGIADIIKLAMLQVHKRLNEDGLRARMLLQVHDELVLDVPREELEAAQTILKDCMENAAELRVPLEVTMGHGRNWLEAH